MDNKQYSFFPDFISAEEDTVVLATFLGGSKSEKKIEITDVNELVNYPLVVCLSKKSDGSHPTHPTTFFICTSRFINSQNVIRPRTLLIKSSQTKKSSQHLFYVP